MTIQPNDHKQTIQHYLTVLVGLFSQIKQGTATQDYLKQVANDIDLDKINAALEWLGKCGVISEERERCAFVCEDRISPAHSGWADGYNEGCQDCANAIRKAEVRE